MTVVAWFEVVVGVGIAGLWTSLLATRRVPELQEGRRDIVFHIAAELVAGLLLVAAGAAVLATGSASASVLAAVAAGALLYTTINSAGYYAELGQWAVVAAFGGLTAVTAASVVVLV